MKDIADAVGVSQSSVSRALSGASTPISISEETRQRIVVAAERLGYRPNPLARALRGGGTRLIGVIVRDIADPFFASAIEAVSREAVRLGYNVVLGHAHGRAEEASALRAVLEARHCDAIVLMGDVRDQPRLLEDLGNSRVPLVALWQGVELADVPTVNVDNAAGVDAALAHLREGRHERIAFVGGPSLGDIRERRRAYARHFQVRGLAVPKGYVVDVENTPASGATALRSLMALAEPPTAILCTTDVLAVGILHAAAAAGIRVPQEMSVVGFDDIPIAAYTVPSLTTVRMPIREMSRTAIQLAVQQIVERSVPRRSGGRIARPTLVVRGSTDVAPEHASGGRARSSGRRRLRG